MKIVQLNTVPNGSTGTIMMNIHNALLNQGHESYVIWGRGRKSNNKNEIYMNDKIGVGCHVIYSRLTDKTGFASCRSTRKLLNLLDKIKPDIIHLHNIHGYYVNIKLLFDYIKANNIKVIWTLHDCWTFTGHCSHFDIIKCEQWKIECINCPQKKEYPKSFFDNSKWSFNKKRETFLGVKDLTIVTPSSWLAKIVKNSFLSVYPVKIINNGINTDIFRIKDVKKINFKEKFNIVNKKIILGVASPWSKWKGLEDFIKLDNIIDHDKFKIVLVGLNEKQINNLPHSILGLPRTECVEELVDIYNSSDVFFNPTYSDNYPTTNLEASSCGLPIITYNTGGSVEIAEKNSKVFIVDKDENNCVEKVKNIIENKINKDERITICNLDYKTMLDKYINLYCKIGD